MGRKGGGCHPGVETDRGLVSTGAGVAFGGGSSGGTYQWLVVVGSFKSHSLHHLLSRLRSPAPPSIGGRGRIPRRTGKRGSVGGWCSCWRVSVGSSGEMAPVSGVARSSRSAACCAVLLTVVFFFSVPATTETYDSLDPNGNITIKWDIISWTPDGYVRSQYSTSSSSDTYPAPGWQLGWSWAKEVIWWMAGALATEQGDCSKFKAPPHCCKRDPAIVDLLPGTHSTNKLPTDPGNAASSFQISVGLAGTTNKTVKMPKNVTLKAPDPGYTCGRALVGRPTRYYSSDGRRVTQALMSWNVICTYSQFLAWKVPSCCVSLSSFYMTLFKLTSQPLVQCTPHMCPIRIHWHSPSPTSTTAMNYTDWNLVAQHPNFDNITRSSASTTATSPYGGGINDTAMFWGKKFYNDLLNEAGPLGNVQSELLMWKDSETFTFQKGWAFPRRVYFNGDNCVMPSPDDYPWPRN
ncbi:hypothetical protein ZWY2020_005911 [Hordeum vulgare]|nr:hypothetical protein ZWY2020_005911 [Hordeum vulgare]